MDIEKLYEYYISLFYLEEYHDMTLIKENDYDLNYIYNYINKLYFSIFK